MFIIQSELRLLVFLFFGGGGGGAAGVTCLVLFSNTFNLFCVLRSRGGNCTSVGVLLFLLIFVAVAVLLFVSVTCCYLSYVAVIRPCCLLECCLCASAFCRQVFSISKAEKDLGE